MDGSDDMDPEIAAVLPQLPILDLHDIPEAREARSELMTVSLADFVPDPDVITKDHTAPGIDQEPVVRVRRYGPRNQDRPLPCLYWIHGGGHVVGQVEQDDPTMEHLVRTLGCVALSVDWRHSPEHPFPAAMNDCYAGLLWAHDNADELGIDPLRIVVGGTSSGGGSAAGLALMARDRGEVPVHFQLLMHPMLDDRNDTPSARAVTDPHLWTHTSNGLAWRAYVGDAVGTDAVHPYAAPSRATDLAGLPPAYIAVGSLDGFADEDIAYAQALRQTGVPVELHVYPRVPHGFDLYAPSAYVSKRYLRDRDEALRWALWS